MKRATDRAFTLVELLVVIGIIAVLIAVLLPSLNAARRSAMKMQCTSNMRQIGMAMLQYQADNRKSGPMPMFIDKLHAYWPSGFMWANELVRQKYIKAPAGVNNANFMGPSVFRCPEEIAVNVNVNTPVYPNPPRSVNSGGVWYWPVPTANDAVAVTYMLNVVAWTKTPSFYNTGPFSAPFLWFQTSAGTPLDDPSHPLAVRASSRIRRSSNMIMMLEGCAINESVPRIAARHGKPTPDGRNAFTNFLFFDGHVATFPTEPFDKGQLAAGASGSTNPGQDGMRLVYHKQRDTLFFITEQSE